MDVGWREQKEERQAGATAEQRMDAIATQEQTGMLSGSMTDGRIGISSAPSEDGCTVDNQIAGPNQPTTKSGHHTEHKERLWQRRSGLLPSFPLVRGTRAAGPAILSQRQAARQGEGRPVAQPVAHILVGEPPQRAQERDEQQRLFTVGPG